MLTIFFHKLLTSKQLNLQVQTVDFLLKNSIQFDLSSNIKSDSIYEEEPKNQKGKIDKLLVSILGLSDNKATIVDPVIQEIESIDNYVKKIQPELIKIFKCKEKIDCLNLEAFKTIGKGARDMAIFETYMNDKRHIEYLHYAWLTTEVRNLNYHQGLRKDVYHFAKNLDKEQLQRAINISTIPVLNKLKKFILDRY